MDKKLAEQTYRNLQVAAEHLKTKDVTYIEFQELAYPRIEGEHRRDEIKRSYKSYEAQRILSRMHLLRNEVRTIETSSSPYIAEVRFIRLTWLGGFFAKWPKIFQIGIFQSVLLYQKIGAIIAALAFIPVLQKAINGALIITDIWQALCALIVSLVVYQLILKSLN